MSKRVLSMALFSLTACLATGGARADDLTAGLPDDLKKLYIGATSALAPSAYDNFKTPAAPWKWCHSESYQGNPVARHGHQRS